MEIPVVKQILSANDEMAAQNRRLLAEHGITAVNIMAAPGAGKTSLILATIAALGDGVRVGVIEGDVASRIDADTIAARGIPVVQINTGGNCHLEAWMVASALPRLPLADLDLLFIENVGNLICPAAWDLGTAASVVVASVPEGHDKPYKYPGMFAAADAVLLNKADLLAYFEFDLPFFERGLRMVNPQAPLFVVSCRNGDGLTPWLDWLRSRRNTTQA
ncbi:MAG: hydrogenase nickel incorporation protein HypB [Anaerolineae bacterium]|nr:hydrogenase nickel incorporation protein HypB [Anaerolineae bacterium]